MKMTFANVLLIGAGLFGAVNGAFAQRGYDDYPRTSRDYDRDHEVKSYSREHERVVVPVYAVPEARLRIKASSRRDHALAHDYINGLGASRALAPSGPPVDVSIRNGKLHLHGVVESSQEHRALVEVARHTPGVVNVQDEITVR